MPRLIVQKDMSFTFEPPHDKTKKMACASSEDRSAWASGSTQADNQSGANSQNEAASGV